MPRFTNADDARTYLASLSDHPNRPGDTSRLHPQYAIAMANSIAEARAAGMPVRLLSGQREGNVTNSKYDRGGYSSHTYGIASDVSGIGGPGSEEASRWRKIAESYGLSSPYDPKGKEWNHWQFGPKLEDDPQLLGRLREAHARGNDVAMWDAYQPTGTATAYNEPAKTVTAPAVDAINSATGSGATLSHEQFIRDYARKIGINPDQAVAIARAEGLNAWSKSNPNAGSYVDRTRGVPWSFGDFQLNTRNGMGVDAIKAGIDPKDPNQWQAADKFALDQMRAHGVGAWSNPVARNIAAHGGLTLNTPQAEGVVDPSIVARGGASPAIPDSSGGTATAAATPARRASSNRFGQATPAMRSKP